VRNYILTIFPPYFTSPLDTGLVRKAIDKGIISVEIVDIRNFCEGKHRQVDDYQFGGGAGLVLRVEPVVKAVEWVRNKDRSTWVVLLDPAGDRFDQDMAWEFSRKESLCLVCGRYEGVDARVEQHVDQLVSVGDYVLHGGEAAALVVLEAAARLIPGFVKTYESALEDSFPTLLDYPHYTKPREFRGSKVPDVLLSGHHAEIESWRKKEALKRTLLRRPDLLESANLTEEEKGLLSEIRSELQGGDEDVRTSSDKKV